MMEGYDAGASTPARSEVNTFWMIVGYKAEEFAPEGYEADMSFWRGSTGSWR